MTRLPLVLLAIAVLALAGCGNSSSGRPDEAATLVLDFQPNAVHAGIYLALARDYTGAEGVDLHVQVPSSSTDSVKLLLSNRAQFAILDLHDLAIAREKGRDLVGVMALVEAPLAAVVAQPGIASPKQLEGRRAGVTGLPSDDAVLSSIVRGAGGDPAKVKRVTIGFDAVRSLLARRVAAATAFWNVEGLALQQRRPGTRIFRVDRYGAPRYPELVLVASHQTVLDNPGLVRATVAAIQRGIRETLVDPDSSVENLVRSVSGLSRAEIAAQLDAVQPALQASDGTIGTFDMPTLRRWAAWEQRFGVVRRRPDVAAMFDPSFARAGEKQAAESSG